MNRLAVILATLSACAAVLVVVDSPPAEAVGVSFQTVQFNMCSRKCTEDLPVAGGSQTNYGIYPADELDRAIAQKGDPRVISLNEVCSPALYTFMMGLPPYAYSVTFHLAKRQGGGCGHFGSVIAAKTLDLAYSDSHSFTFYYAPYAGPPPPGSSQERRGGACSESAIFIEYFGACASHLTTGGGAGAQADSYRAGVDTWFAGRARMGIGDFNLTPEATQMTAWRATGYRDAHAGFAVTYEGGGNHIDYGYFGGPLSGPDGTGAAYSSSSDHHLLFSPIHFS